MRPRPEVVLGLALVVMPAARSAAEPATKATGDSARDGGHGALFDAGPLRSRKEPIVVTSDTLEYDYKANVVVYRGTVQATQGPVKVRSDTLTVTFAADPGGAAPAKTAGDVAVPDPAAKGTQRLQEVIATGNVRIDNAGRWATGGRAVFDQTQRTLVLTETPVLHDGVNEVAGDRVVVYLDEDRSVVEGGRKRVKAVLYPNKDGGLAPAEKAEKKESGDAAEASAHAAGAVSGTADREAPAGEAAPPSDTARSASP